MEIVGVHGIARNLNYPIRLKLPLIHHRRTLTYLQASFSPMDHRVVEKQNLQWFLLMGFGDSLVSPVLSISQFPPAVTILGLAATF